MKQLKPLKPAGLPERRKQPQSPKPAKPLKRLKRGAASKPGRPLKLRRRSGRSAARDAAPAASAVPGDAGWTAGYRDGLRDGRHFALCEMIRARAAAQPVRRFDVSVLYVKADGFPYASLDQGIEEALRATTRHTTVVGPNEDIVGAAEARRADLVLVLDASGRQLPNDPIARLRAKGIRTAVWLPDDPYHSDQTVAVAKQFDSVLTIEESCVPLYEQSGCPRVRHLPLGVNPQFMRQSRVDAAYRSDVCFIGSAFWNRVELFDAIADDLAGRKLTIIGYWWERLRSFNKLSHAISGIWLPPEETAKYYSGAKIVINLHRSADDPSHNSNSRGLPALSVNPRLFEIAACGTLQLVDVRPGLPALYTPGHDIVTFGSPQELVDRIDYYLSHEEERQQLVRRTLQRTVDDHTYRRRVEQLLEFALG